MFKKLWLKFRPEKKSVAQTVHALLKSKNYTIKVYDEKSLIVSVGKPLCALVEINKDKKQVCVESTLIIDGDILNLRTYSSMAHTAMTYGFNISGIVPHEGGSVKVYMGKKIDFKVLEKIPSELKALKKCLRMIVQYIQQRSKKQILSALDLSMFSEIDIDSFDPQQLGEQKDLVYRTWQDFAEAILLSENIEDSSNMIKQINACAEFERLNKMNLSEVGDAILNELVWNKGFDKMVAGDNKYHIQ